jgi:catechol 2,3-dioxygenase-like lactoylglutathione lyase family enzyme
MGVAIAKDSIDLGIVVRDAQAALKFYRDTLGLVQEPDTPFPAGGTMHRLRCGTSLIKLVAPSVVPDARPEPGNIPNASGYRYWTITVSNLDEIMGQCEAGGYKIVVPKTEVRPGITIGIVEDPDGNWVEFIG